jgi:hypothetical protein
MYNGMGNGTLVIIHNGSFMKEISPHILSAAVMIYCKTTKKYANARSLKNPSPLEAIEERYLGE